MSDQFGIGQVAIAIDNREPVPGDLNIEREVITYSTLTGTKPAMSWTLIDNAGHFHAYDDQGELPTLTARSRHVDCDGSCGEICDGEGYDVIDHFCAICDEPIEPERVSDAGEKSMPGRMMWHVIAHPDQLIEGKVSVRIQWPTGGETMFGVAIARTERVDRDMNGTRITTRLEGIGPLGKRRAA